MTLMQYADDLYAKSCKVKDADDESTLNKTFIKEVDPSVSHILREYWNSTPQADLSDIAVKVQTRPAI